MADGTWLDLNDPADKAKLLGAGAVFINGVRALVPLRLAAALALAPAVEGALGKLGGGGDSSGKGGDDVAGEMAGKGVSERSRATRSREAEGEDEGERKSSGEEDE